MEVVSSAAKRKSAEDRAHGRSSADAVEGHLTGLDGFMKRRGDGAKGKNGHFGATVAQSSKVEVEAFDAKLKI